MSEQQQKRKSESSIEEGEISSEFENINNQPEVKNLSRSNSFSSKISYKSSQSSQYEERIYKTGTFKNSQRLNNTKEIVDNKNRVICSDYVKNMCDYGQACGYSHYLKHYPCKIKLAYGQCNKENCEFGHYYSKLDLPINHIIQVIQDNTSYFYEVLQKEKKTDIGDILLNYLEEKFPNDDVVDKYMKYNKWFSKKSKGQTNNKRKISDEQVKSNLPPKDNKKQQQKQKQHHKMNQNMNQQNKQHQKFQQNQMQYNNQIQQPVMNIIQPKITQNFIQGSHNMQQYYINNRNQVNNMQYNQQQMQHMNQRYFPQYGQQQYNQYQQYQQNYTKQYPQYMQNQQGQQGQQQNYAQNYQYPIGQQIQHPQQFQQLQQKSYQSQQSQQIHNSQQQQDQIENQQQLQNQEQKQNLIQKVKEELQIFDKQLHSNIVSFIKKLIDQPIDQKKELIYTKITQFQDDQQQKAIMNIFSLFHTYEESAIVQIYVDQKKQI